MSRKRTQLQRRRFLKTALSAGAAVMAPQLIPSTALAVEPTTRDIHFYISTAFQVGGITASELESRLVTYVDHMNNVLEKNTNLRLNYQASLCHHVPQNTALAPDNYSSTDPPPENHHFAVHIGKSTSGSSSGAIYYRTGEDEFSVIAGSGSGWGQIYHPDERSSSDPTVRYWYAYQVIAVLHELAHIHGAGKSEYYHTKELLDFTQTTPNASEHVTSSPGSYWHANARQPVKFDPLMAAHIWLYEDVFDVDADARFCQLTAKIIDDHALGSIPLSQFYYFNYPQVPQNSYFSVQVVNSLGYAQSGVAVELYKTSLGEDPNDPGHFYLAAVAPPHDIEVTDSSGMVYFYWPSGSPHDPNNNRILLAASAPVIGRKKVWLTVFDMHAAARISGGGSSGSYRLPSPLQIVI